MKLLSVFLFSAFVALFSVRVSYAQDNITQPPEAEGGRISVNGALGATIINGKSYQYFSLRPDIPIWRFGVGLDLSFYFDEEGKLREDDWDEGADYIEKIYYVRYGKPGDNLYLRAGALDAVTLGYGLIMRRYSNAIEWPQVKRVGLHSQVKVGAIGAEALVNNFREIDSPGLVAGRVTYTMQLFRPVVFGATIAHDGNQYLGAKDADKDGIPDRQDMFPGKKDGEHINWLRGLLTQFQVEQMIASGDLPDILHPPASIQDRDAPVTEYGVDAGLALLQTQRMSLWLYAQAAKIDGYGMGVTFPGAVWTMGPFHAGVEFRMFQKEFLGDYFDYSYEVARVTWDETSQNYITRSEKLKGIPAGKGFFADAGVNVFNLVDVYAAYTKMFYDNSDVPSQSFAASASLKPNLIPRIDLAQVYFEQPRADKLFSTDSDGTTVGYTVGTAMGAGVMLKYDNKVIYHNGEPNRIMTIETVVKFR